MESEFSSYGVTLSMKLMLMLGFLVFKPADASSNKLDSVYCSYILLLFLYSYIWLLDSEGWLLRMLTGDISSELNWNVIKKWVNIRIVVHLISIDRTKR